MSLTAAKKYIELAPVEPAPRGFLKGADVRPSADVHELLGVESQTDACADAEVWADICEGVDGTFCGPIHGVPSEVKDFYDSFDQIDGEPFAVYSGVECRLLGSGGNDEDRAARRLSYGEGRQVDAQIIAWMDANSVDLTPAPGTAVGVVDALALLENFISAGYGGMGYIWGYPSTTVCADALDVIEPQLDSTLSTSNGNRFCPLSGVAVEPDPKYLYVTGRVTLIQGPVSTFSVPETVRADGTCDPARSLAERIYVPLIECLVARVEVDC